MLRQNRPIIGIIRILSLLLVLVLIQAAVLPLCARAEDGKSRVVRVGWFESPYYMTDSFGRRSGYAYEYQQKIAAYTGWKYEYVEGNWPDLFQKLINGEIDLLSDVSLTKERAEKMLFPSLPMGTEEYYIFVDLNNAEIKQEDPRSLSGKRIGANKGSIQVDLFNKWAKENAVQADLIELTKAEEDAWTMIQKDKLDAYITIDAYGSKGSIVPTYKIGSSDYFFVVNKERSDLLEELNGAMSSIQDEDRFYNQELFNKYVRSTGAYVFLDPKEREWISSHETVRVGYQDNYLSFCAADKDSGELTGALKDYLSHASDCLENASLSFEPIAYPKVSAALEALRKGEVDCVFPSNLSTSDSEELGLVMTPSIMRAELYAVVRKSDKESFAQKEEITVAMEEDQPNVESVIKDHFPTWKEQYYPDMQSCLRAVSDGRADCVLISNYQYNSYGRMCEQYRLTSLTTGKTVEYYIAVKRENNELYSILAKTTAIVSNTTINAALTYYSSEDARTRFLDFIMDNILLVIAVVVLIIALVFILIIQRRMIIAERKAAESQHLAENLSERVYVDALTSVRNKGAFEEYIKDIQDRMDGGEQTEFAICIFDCDNLKDINDQYGHEKGDIYLQTASQHICRIFQHSAVFRIGGDEFSAVLLNGDFRDREQLLERFDKAQEQTNASEKDAWKQVRVSVGAAVFDAQQDSSVNDTIRRADELMYENKRERKMKR